MPPESVDLAPLLSAARVTIVAGKGGVGKTTVTAVLARAAADSGKRVLAVELDGKPFLAGLLAGSDGHDDVPHLALSAPRALEEYLREHGFGRIAKRLSTSGVIDVVSTAAPGIDDLVVLGRIKQLERSGAWDAIVVDGPAAGHAMTMLTAAAGLQDAVSGGPVRAQAEDVLALLRDETRCQVAMVTLPEATPVGETVETAFAIEDRVGTRLAPVIVNAVDTAAPGWSIPTGADLGAALDAVDAAWRPALSVAASFRVERRAAQQAAIERLAAALPLRQIHLPLLPVAGFDPDTVIALGRAARHGPRASDPVAR